MSEQFAERLQIKLDKYPENMHAVMLPILADEVAREMGAAAILMEKAEEMESAENAVD